MNDGKLGMLEFFNISFRTNLTSLYFPGTPFHPYRDLEICQVANNTAADKAGPEDNNLNPFSNYLKDDNLNPFSGSNSIVFSKNNPFMDVSGGAEDTETKCDKDSDSPVNSLEVAILRNLGAADLMHLFLV